jgi:hypothetical protein
VLESVEEFGILHVHEIEENSRLRVVAEGAAKLQSYQSLKALCVVCTVYLQLVKPSIKMPEPTQDEIASKLQAELLSFTEGIERESREQRHEPVPLPKHKPGETFKFGPSVISTDENNQAIVTLGKPMMVRADGTSYEIDFSNPDHVHLPTNTGTGTEEKKAETKDKY